MHPPYVERYIYPKSSRQDWTLAPLPVFLWYGLNTGVTNSFDFHNEKGNCTDPISVFGGIGQPQEADLFLYDAIHNFWNCAFYPNLSHDARELILPEGNRTLLLNRQVDISLSTSTKVTSFLSNCLTAYCDKSAHCDMSSCTIEQLSINSSMLSASSVDSCLDNICKGAWGNVGNPDIAGIGVVTSYMIQVGMSGIAFLSLAMCVVALGAVLRDTRPRTEANIVKKVAKIQAVLETLLITLDDFQRAQCCFATAIALASLTTLTVYASSITQQDRSAMTMASTAGIGPTTWILTCLMALNERHSALTFWWTFITWILSLAVGFHPQTFERRVTSSSYPRACGEIPPVYLCDIQAGPWGSASLLLFAPIFSMPLLLVWHLWPTAARCIQYLSPEVVCRPTPKIYTSMSTSGTGIRDMRLRIGWFSGIVVSIVLASGVVSFGVFTATLISYILDGNVNSEWTFGQIVAIAVWTPSFLSLLNDVVYGPVRGRTQQLPDTLELVRIPMVRNN